MLLCFPVLIVNAETKTNQSFISSFLVSQAGISISGDTNMFGATSSYSRPGDINGDGIDDLLVFDRFSTFIFFGKSESWTNKTVTEADVTITKGTSTTDYQSAGGVGDINNDGINDITVSPFSCTTMCYAYIFFGRNIIDWANVKSLDDANIKLSENKSDDFLGDAEDYIEQAKGRANSLINDGFNVV